MKTNLVQFSKEEVDKVWPLAKELVHKACIRAGGFISEEHIKEHCKNGTMQLWLAITDTNEILCVGVTEIREYPNYKEIIPENFKTVLKFSRTELIEKIKVISPFSSKVNDIKLEVENEKLVKISAISPEVGSSTATIKIKTSKNPSLGEVIFNYRYLLDGLENISTEKVRLLLNTKDSPAALKPEGKDDFLYLIMPIRV